MKRPCPHCPFRSDIRPFIRPDRVREIMLGLYSGMEFPCHKTVDYDHEDDEGEGRVTGDTQECAGAAILMGRHGWQSHGLDMNSPVYKSWGAMLRAHRKATP